MERTILVSVLALAAGCATVGDSGVASSAAPERPCPAHLRCDPPPRPPRLPTTAEIVEKERAAAHDAPSCPGNLPRIEGACWHESRDGKWRLGRCEAGLPSGTLFVDDK